MAATYLITETNEHATSGTGGVPTSSTQNFTIQAQGEPGNYKTASFAFHQYVLAHYAADSWGNPIEAIELVEDAENVGWLWRGSVRHAFPSANAYAGAESYVGNGGDSSEGSSSSEGGVNWFPFISSFTIAGGTKHVVQSYATRAYPVAGQVVDFNGGIGWDGEGFEGVDIPCPAVNFDVTARTPAGFLANFARYLNRILPLVGTVNASKFYGCDPGTVLFNGITSGQLKTGTSSTTGERFSYWEMSFSFSAMPNAILNIGGQAVPKSGWEYLWPLVGDDGSILASYVETVFQSSDFGLLGLGGKF